MLVLVTCSGIVFWRARPACLRRLVLRSLPCSLILDLINLFIEKLLVIKILVAHLIVIHAAILGTFNLVKVLIVELQQILLPLLEAKGRWYLIIHI